MRVPLLDLCAQYEKLKSPIDEAVGRVLKSGRYVLGPEVQAFETELGEYLKTDGQAPKVVAVSSGSDALLGAAMALGIGLGCRPETAASMAPDDEVVTTAYSFFATAETAIRLGVRPVFADIEEDGFNADLSDLLSKMSRRTRAVLPVHLFGLRMPVLPIAERAKSLGPNAIPILEDAAQTLVPGIGSGTHAATLSFFPSKNLGAAGDAGAIVTHDAELYEALVAIRQHGSRPKYVHSLWGGNFRMDPIQAAILRVKLSHLRAWQQQRRQNAGRYHEALAELGPKGAHSVGLRLPPHPDQSPEHAFHHFVVRTPRRDALRAYLTERGIETEIYYPMPLHLQPCFAHLGYRPGSCPRAEAAAQQALALPIHPDLHDDQVFHVAESIRAFFNQ